MCTQQSGQNHLAASFQHHLNHQHLHFKCYLRTPDMKSKIESISTSQFVGQLKEQISRVLNLSSFGLESNNPQQIRLIVNQQQLTSQMNLSLHLYANAIIHVIPIFPQSSPQSRSNSISIKIKQPPINCPTYSIQKINPFILKVQQFKAKVIQFYKNEHPEEDIAKLTQSQLYLVYCGRIMIGEKLIGDYDVSENGVVYLVNANIYAREVTKQQAERRIQEVKNKRTPAAQEIFQQRQEETNNGLSQDHQNLIFNIIQNIVHDQDSDVQGQASNDLQRSQKIIHRYDSLNQEIQLGNNQEDNVREEKYMLQSHKQQHQGEERCEERPVMQFLQDLGKKIVSVQERNRAINEVDQAVNQEQVVVTGQIQSYGSPDAEYDMNGQQAVILSGEEFNQNNIESQPAEDQLLE